MEADWRSTLLVCRRSSDGAAGNSVIPDVGVTKQPQLAMRDDLLELFEIDELEKYYTDAELAEHPGRRT